MRSSNRHTADQARGGSTAHFQSNLGPPRFVRGYKALSEEVARQRQLIARGYLRRLFPGVRGTVGWCQGERVDGMLVWSWSNGGNYFGGLWSNESDRERAWRTALKEQQCK